MEDLLACLCERSHDEMLPPLRIHTPYTTPYETRSMRALAALRSSRAAVYTCVSVTAVTCEPEHWCGFRVPRGQLTVEKVVPVHLDSV